MWPLACVSAAVLLTWMGKARLVSPKGLATVPQIWVLRYLVLLQLVTPPGLYKGSVCCGLWLRITSLYGCRTANEKNMRAGGISDGDIDASFAGSG